VPSPTLVSPTPVAPTPAPSVVRREVASLVTGPSPLAECAVGGERVQRGSEVEPSLAVDPRDPDRIVVAWQQDRRRDGAAAGIGVASSDDGGRTWARDILPVTRCATQRGLGGRQERASDPWLSAAPDGTFHLAVLLVDDDRDASAIAAFRSDDGGRTWGAPALLQEDEGAGNDKESILADPYDASRVYAIWDRLAAPDAEDPDVEVLFTRSLDHGRSWERPRTILRTAPTPLGHVLEVLPDRSLLDIYLDIPPDDARPTALRSLRSSDGGLTWQGPELVTEVVPWGFRDPASGQGIRTGYALPAIGVDRHDGAVYVAWADGRWDGGQSPRVAFVRSGDGGRTWSEPARPGPASVGAASFTPAVSVAPDGTVAIGSYDVREDTPGGALLTARWLALSADGGATWRERALTPRSFDLTGAPSADGLFLGDYVGQASVDGLVLSAHTVTSSGPDGGADIAFRSIAP
jgi:hypothetical protein